MNPFLLGIPISIDSSGQRILPQAKQRTISQGEDTGITGWPLLGFMLGIIALLMLNVFTIVHLYKSVFRRETVNHETNPSNLPIELEHF